MKLKRPWLVVDGNAIGYAGMHSSNKGKIPNKSVIGFVNSLMQLKKWQPDAQILVLWDGHAQWRYDIYPGYKGKRDSNEKLRAIREEYRKQRSVIVGLLHLIGVRQLVAADFEADDLAGYFVRRSPDRHITLVTGDMDWCQLVGHKVRWFDPRGNGKHITLANFQEQTKHPNPLSYLQFKALRGDSSDNISGIYGFGPKCEELVVSHYKSVTAVLDAYATSGCFNEENTPESFPSRHIKTLNAIAENKEIIARNLALMNLRSDKRDKEIAGQLEIPAPPVINDLEEYLLAHSLSGMVSRLPQIVRNLTKEIPYVHRR